MLIVSFSPQECKLQKYGGPCLFLFKHLKEHLTYMSTQYISVEHC